MAAGLGGIQQHLLMTSCASLKRGEEGEHAETEPFAVT